METNAFPTVDVLPEDPTPFPVLSALWDGARRVLRRWPVLLLMLLGALLSAGLLALVPALNLLYLAHRPVIARMAAGIPAWQLVDLTNFIDHPASPPHPVNLNLAMLLIAFLVMPLVGGVVSAFLYGGVLLTYKEDASPAGAPPFRLGRFLWGSWHWFGATLALGLFQALVFFALYLAVIGLAAFLFGKGALGIAAAVVLVILLVGLDLIIFELARVRLVLNGIRNPFRALALAFGDLFHRPLPLLAFYAAALILLLMVQAVFRLGINPRVPLDALITALLVQQGFILARLFCQALRLAGLVAWLKP